MNLATLMVLAAPVIVVLVVVRKRSKVSRVRSATVSIQADEAGVERLLADGRTESVAWDEVVEVDVFRTRVGPHKPAGGGVVLYGTAERGCIIPLDRLEESSLLVHIHRLPGFDVGPLIAAVSAEAGGLAPSDSSIAFLSPRPLQTTVTCWTRADVRSDAAEAGVSDAPGDQDPADPGAPEDLDDDR